MASIDEEQKQEQHHLSGYGVKYITPTLIAKHSNIDDMKQLSHITELDLSFKHSDEHKISVLEHLDRCPSLTKLTICSQSLTKMNGLQRLHSLIELDLSGNKIAQIQHLKTLSNLQKLDLSFNCITAIPPHMSHLSQLHTLNLSRNKIQNIRDTLNLRQCSNLQKLDLNNNPIYSLTHYRQFIIYYLSQISMFDSHSISQTELIESRQRFERNECDKLINECKQKDSELQSLKNNIANLRQYKSESQQTISELNAYIEQQKQSIEDLNTQISTQHTLIRGKNESLLQTRHELSEMEEKYQELQLSAHSISHNANESDKYEQKDESESLLQIEMPQSDVFLPPKLSESCQSYLESIESINALIGRYNDLRTQYENGKENMSVIHEQIIKSNKALQKLKERNNIRTSMDNPFENEEFNKILSEPPSFDIGWNVSPILAKTQTVNINVSEDSIKAKLSEAHRIDEEISRIEQELRNNKHKMDRTNNGSLPMTDNDNVKDELVQQFAQLIESMDAIEHSFSMQQKLSHSQDFDSLRIKLVSLYIRRYKNEESHVREVMDRLESETHSIETQMNEYLSNRNQLLLDIHRILSQCDSDCIAQNNYKYIPETYTNNLPQSMQCQYEELKQALQSTKAALDKEKNVCELLRNQIQQRSELNTKSSGKHILGNNNRIVQDLIVRAETAENRVHELSFMSATKQSHKNRDKGLELDLSMATDKIKELETLLKNYESDLVVTLEQKLKESETECDRLHRETEEKLSFAKYLMTTKEQRLEAEKTINITLQREIEEMKEQSGIFSPTQYQSPFGVSNTVPMSMNTSMRNMNNNNERLFDSQPMQGKYSLVSDNGSDNDAVQLNIDNDDDLLSVDSTQQNIVQLSLRLSNLRDKVSSEEERIRELENKKTDLTAECGQCLEKLNDIQSEISVCKDKKQVISDKLAQIESAHKENKRMKESEAMMQELMVKSSEYSNKLVELENNTNALLSQKENASKELNNLVKEIEMRKSEYSQITKRIQIKNFELSNLSAINHSGNNDNTMDSKEEEIDDYDQSEDTETKKGELKRVCEALDSTLKQLNTIKSELRNHRNYHKIIRLDAIETEIEQRVKELSRVKTRLSEKRNMERSLNEKISETTQTMNGIEYEMSNKQMALNNKIRELETMEQSLDKKKSELQSLHKTYDKKHKRLVSLNGKLSTAEQLLKDISLEQQNASVKLKSCTNELYSKENELESSMDLLRRSSTTNDAMKLFKVIEQIECEQKALNEIQTQIQSGNSELKQLQNIITSHKTEISALQTEEIQIKNGLKAQSKDKEMKDVKIDELLAQINELQRNKRTVTREIEMESNTLNESKAQLNQQKSEMRKLKREYTNTDKELNDKRYKLMSAEHDLSEIQSQTNVLKGEYGKIKARIKHKSDRQSQTSNKEMELYKIYKKEQKEREMRLETYNSQLIEMDKQCNHKKGVMLQYESDLENVKTEIHESNAKYKEMKDEQMKTLRLIQVNKGKLSIYEKEVETQRHCLETLYEKKRQKTVELFKEKSTEIKDANDRLQQLQQQINTVCLELDSKRRALNDINEEKCSNEMALKQQSNERSTLRQTLLNIKSDINDYESTVSNKKLELQSMETQCSEMTERMGQLKGDLTKKSEELLEDKSIELQAIQFQINKAREEVIELSKLSLDKNSEMSALNKEISIKESAIMNKQNKLYEIDAEIERYNSDLGEIDAKIQLKTKELSHIKNMITDYSKENKKNELSFEILDIESALNDKDTLLKSANEKYEKLLCEIREKENNLSLIGETIRKRSEDYEKLENELRQNSFESLRVKSENVQQSELSQSLHQNLQKTQFEFDDLQSKLHQTKKELSTKKREFENIKLEINKLQSTKESINNELLQINDKRNELSEINHELKSKELALSELNIKYENVKNEFEAMTNNIATNQIRYSTITTEINNLNKLKMECQNNIGDKQKELVNISNELERTKLDLELQSDELYTSKSERMKVIMSELGAKAKELNENKKRQRSIKDLLLLKEKELKELTNNISSFKLKLTQMTTNYNDIQRKLKNKRNELRVITNEIQNSQKNSYIKNNDTQYLSELSAAIQLNKDKLSELDCAILEKKKIFENIRLNINEYSNDLDGLKKENAYYNQQKISKLGQINDLTLEINHKKQELDKAKLEIELKSQQIDSDISIKMKEILTQIADKKQELNGLKTEIKSKKENELLGLTNNIREFENKLQLLNAQIKSKQENKMNLSNKLAVINESIHTYNTALINKQNKLSETDKELELKLSQINELSSEFDEQSQELRTNRNSLQQINTDIDDRNTQLQSIIQRLDSAKTQIKSMDSSIKSSIDFGENISHISTPEQARNQNQSVFDVSLEEMNDEMNESTNADLSLMHTTSPQIIIRTVEKLRRTIDAMCYPRGGCIFSLSSIINHYNSALRTLEQNRQKLVGILQSAPNKNIEFKESESEKANITAQQQSLAVNDLGKIWEELQTIKKVRQKLKAERHHLYTSLSHAMSVIGKEGNESNDRSNENGAMAVIEDSVNKVLQSIDTQGSVWRNNLSVFGDRLKDFELKFERLKNENDGTHHKFESANNNDDDREMGHILSELETHICDKKSQLESVDAQLNKQRILLSQLKAQSDRIAEKLHSQNGTDFYHLSSSPTMARQIASKLRFEKELNDLKQELHEKKSELTAISAELSEQSAQLSREQNILLQSIESGGLSRRVEEIQKLYKLREKNLKQRIDSYKKELQKRDKELNALLVSDGSAALNINRKQIIAELKQLQTERSKMINRRDLRNQIQERDEQIAFLIAHFSKQSVDRSQNQLFQISNDSFSNDQMRSEALSQIEANLTSALAPFQISEDMQTKHTKKHRKQNKKHRANNIDSSAYHFVPATASSSENRDLNNLNKDMSLLHSIFGGEQSGTKERQHRGKYQRETFSSKQKRKRNKERKRGLRYNHNGGGDSDDNDNDEHSNFILDDHEDRYNSLDRKYG